MNRSAIFHLAIPINDIVLAKEFYADSLGCQVGRQNKVAVIFDFYGVQLVGHLTNEPLVKQAGIYPRHFGLILPTQSDWQAICDRAIEQQLTFFQQPKLRFPQQVLEHYSFFLADPFDNLLEFKYYSNPVVIFDAQEFNSIGETVVSDSVLEEAERGFN
ncbi:glyoxalase/bleomycin resistance protein/dioxygenase [Chondrocystis sp. NIES-4102]|nr:glyoxalase/bleomycin resistance protein/dioxygenase [Chondrocystis sp. NIES-4102]